MLKTNLHAGQILEVVLDAVNWNISVIAVINIFLLLLALLIRITFEVKRIGRNDVNKAA